MATKGKANPPATPGDKKTDSSSGSEATCGYFSSKVAPTISFKDIPTGAR